MAGKNKINEMDWVVAVEHGVDCGMVSWCGNMGGGVDGGCGGDDWGWK